MLNTTYQNIGFGIDNIPNYQNSGPETLVDAMFASPANQSVVAATPPTQTTTTPVSSQNSSSPTPTQSSSPTTTTNASTQPTSTPVSSPIATTKQAPTTATGSPTKSTSVGAEPQQQQITRIQLVANGNTSDGIALVVIFGVVAFAFLLLRHGLAWRKTLVRGEKFVLRHPVFDIIAVTVVTASVLLTRTSGLIR
jgi:hypothetical protein